MVLDRLDEYGIGGAVGAEPERRLPRLAWAVTMPREAEGKRITRTAGTPPGNSRCVG